MEAAVLHLNDKQHDFGLQDSKILETNGFRPSVGNYCTWDAEEIIEAKQIAGKTLSKLGYEIQP